MKLDSSHVTIISFIIVTIIFCLLSLFHIYENFLVNRDNEIPEYLKHKSKSFDAEREMIRRCGIDSVWRSQPSKMYSAEQQGVDMYGEAGGFIGKTLKYY